MTRWGTLRGLRSGNLPAVRSAPNISRMPYHFVVRTAGVVLGRPVQPGDVVTLAVREGRIALAVELPFNPGGILAALEDGLLDPIDVPVADVQAQLRPTPAQRAQRPVPRVLPFPAPSRREA